MKMNRITLFIFSCQNNGVIIESMDACFGLYRKKTKGNASQGDTRYKNEFFADQNDVDNFIDNYKNASKLSADSAGKVHTKTTFSHMCIT